MLTGSREKGTTDAALTQGCVTSPMPGQAGALYLADVPFYQYKSMNEQKYY